jgi:glutamine amidotransferase
MVPDVKDRPAVCIIDYGIGNVASVRNALALVGVDAAVSGDAETIRKADRLILPGVGAFGEGMNNLKERGLIPVLQDEVLHKKKNILGICLGMQLFASRGFEHGEHAGLGFIPGDVIKLDVPAELRLPHIGWNNVSVSSAHQLTKHFDHEPIFYFVHSYHLVPEDPSVIAGTASYGKEFAAIVEKGNICGAQFHPEKSHADGLQILKNFLALC